jgi:hypothetical protein
VHFKAIYWADALLYILLALALLPGVIATRARRAAAEVPRVAEEGA